MSGAKPNKAQLAAMRLTAAGAPGDGLAHDLFDSDEAGGPIQFDPSGGMLEAAIGSLLGDNKPADDEEGVACVIVMRASEPRNVAGAEVEAQCLACKTDCWLAPSSKRIELRRLYLCGTCIRDEIKRLKRAQKPEGMQWAFDEMEAAHEEYSKAVLGKLEVGKPIPHEEMFAAAMKMRARIHEVTAILSDDERRQASAYARARMEIEDRELAKAVKESKK